MQHVEAFWTLCCQMRSVATSSALCEAGGDSQRGRLADSAAADARAPVFDSVFEPYMATFW